MRKEYITGNWYETYKEFGESRFCNVYKNASRKLYDIISRNEEEWQESKIKYKEISNILSFVGKRGTGKTSVMSSFAENLNYLGRIGDDGFKEFSQKAEFFCLGCIDCSLMEAGEDIFKSVLARMYQEYQILLNDSERERKNDWTLDFQTREINRKFEALYKALCTLETMSKNTLQSGESYMSSLSNLSSSQRIREQFEELVDEYLDALRRRGTYNRIENPRYLVVVVDDIDLNIENGFAMLERIHRYMMVSNIVVMLSLDYEQMLSICMNYFYKVLPRVDNALNEGLPGVKAVAIDYLDKVLPPAYRIEMPDFEDAFYPFDVLENQREKREMLSLILKKTSIAYDINGLKRHFFQSKSARIFANRMITLQNMDSLQEYILENGDEIKTDKNKNRKFCEICDINLSFLKAEIKTRTNIDVKLTREQKELLEKILQMDVRRSIEKIYNYCMYQLDKDYDAEVEVNYGKLVNVLYDLGRTSKGDYNAFIQCIFAYLTYEMTRKYLYEKYEMNEKYDNDTECSHSSDALKEIIGDSIAGEWTKYFLPELIIQESPEEPVDQGRKKWVEVSRRDINRINPEESRILFSLFKTPFPIEKLRENSIFEFIDWIYCYEILFF